VKTVPIAYKSALLNICFLPSFFDLTLPASVRRLNVNGDTFNSKAASFNVSHYFA
jgi:hypothetical protein